MNGRRRMAVGAALAIGLGLTGCGETEQITNDDAGVTVEEEFGSDDQVDGGEEDTPANDDADIDDETGTDG